MRRKGPWRRACRALGRSFATSLQAVRYLLLLVERIKEVEMGHIYKYGENALNV